MEKSTSTKTTVLLVLTGVIGVIWVLAGLFLILVNLVSESQVHQDFPAFKVMAMTNALVNLAVGIILCSCAYLICQRNVLGVSLLRGSMVILIGLTVFLALVQLVLFPMQENWEMLKPEYRRSFLTLTVVVAIFKVSVYGGLVLFAHTQYKAWPKLSQGADAQTSSAPA